MSQRILNHTANRENLMRLGQIEEMHSPSLTEPYVPMGLQRTHAMSGNLSDDEYVTIGRDVESELIRNGLDPQRWGLPGVSAEEQLLPIA